MQPELVGVLGSSEYEYEKATGHLGVWDRHGHDVRRQWSTVFMEGRALSKRDANQCTSTQGVYKSRMALVPGMQGLRKPFSSSDLVRVLGDAIGPLKKLGWVETLGVRGPDVPPSSLPFRG